MSLDLRLLPVDGDYPPAVFYSHCILSLVRNQFVEDISAIAEKHAEEIPEPLICYLGHHDPFDHDEHGYGPAIEDPYGNPLTFVLAKHLKVLRPKKVAYGVFNCAVLAFIRALPDDYKIVLYWN